MALSNKTESTPFFNRHEFVQIIGAVGAVQNSASPKSDDDELILSPSKHLENSMTINIFVSFINAMNYWLKIPEVKINSLINIMKIMNSYGVLCDDIQDNTGLRGGNPAAHLIYGIPLTMKAVNYLSFMVLDELKKLEHPKAIQIGYEYLLAVFRGQGLEVYWRDHHLCPSETDYMMMSVDKSSSTFMFMVRLMQLFSKNQNDFNHFGNLVGLFLQIRDDYCNFWSAKYEKSKGFCEDLTEGKFNFSLINAIQKEGSNSEVLRILKQRPTDSNTKKRCILLVEKLGSHKLTEQMLDYIGGELKKEVERFEPNLMMEELLKSFMDWKKEGSLIQ